ncbi:retrovirus-related pol polyprotein from transposon TNT 1-94 [Tanacetum coccineum]
MHKVLAPGLLKIETEPINEYFKNNRVVHCDYLRVTKEHVATLQELLEQARALKPLDEHIGYASKFAARIQELLVTITKEHVVKQDTRKTDNTMLPSTGRVSSTNASGSKPRSNTKNDKILQPSSRSKKNKVKAHHRKFKSSANKNNNVSNCNANVKNVTLLKNFDTICLSCNECLFSANHDACVVQYLKKNAKTKIVPPSSSNDTSAIVVPPGHILTTTVIPVDALCPKLSRRYANARMKSFHLGSLATRSHLAIMGYKDLQIGNILISHVYYVEGLGVDLLSSSRGSNLYTISIADMIKSFPICLLSKTSKTKSWLWHRRFSHLNFGTINKLAKQGLVKGLPKLKYTKDYLCLACQMGKSKKESYPHKPEPSTNEKLQMLHMDLCGPMRVESINKKRYILVIVDDYFCLTWLKFLRTKDEAPKIIIKFFKQAQVSLNATVRYSHTDNGIDFHNQTLRNYTEEVRITHMTSTTCTLQQNGVVERRNHTLVEAARIMLIFSKSLLFLWAKAIATTCYTQNCYLIHTRYNKTPYELLRDRKPELKYLHVFGALCYLTNDFGDLGKLQPKADIGIFIGLVLNQAASTSSKPPTKNDWDLLFQPMFDEYFKNPSTAFNPISVATLPPPDIVGVSSSSTSIDIDSLSPSTSPNNEATNSPLNSTNVEPNEEVAMFDSDTFTNLFALPDTSLIDSSLICTDIANFTRKRLKPDKHEHGNGRAHKEPGECYQKSTMCMRTRNSYFPNNSHVTIPRRRNKNRVPNIVEPELRTIVAPMAERTMEELLRAPTEGYGEAIVLPEMNADHFEIKMNLLQLVQANPFYGRENDNPHAHINSFKSITSTLRFRNVPNDVIRLMMFPYFASRSR